MKLLNLGLDKKKGEFAIPVDHKVCCYNIECEWKGKISNCDTEVDSDGWEYPEYEILICPKCGGPIDV